MESTDSEGQEESDSDVGEAMQISDAENENDTCCIICQKFNCYTKVKRMKVKESLTKTSEKDKENIIKNANQNILMAIQMNGSHQIHHHSSCYRNLTKNITNNYKRRSGFDFPSVFSKFTKEIIEPRLIENHEVMDMDELFKCFKNVAKKVTSTKINARKFYLKSKLKQKYPKLSFSRTHYKRTEVVFTKDIPQETLIKKHENLRECIKNLDQDLSNSEENYEDEASNFKPEMANIGNEETILYRAAIILKNLIKQKQTSSTPWPPTSSDLNLESTKEMIPPLLFNFLAWATCNNEEPEFVNFVETSNDHKILSICQDIAYLTMKGRHPTPKSLALGMAVKHITGSARVVDILNGLGHCVSHNVVVSHETALAQQASIDEIGIPLNIVKFQPTILVWDNNDFQEETLSGHGTTHNTNGIIIQASSETHQQNQCINQRICLKRGIRTFQTTQTSILQNPHKNTKAKGPGPFPNLKTDMQQYDHLLLQPHLLHCSYQLTKVAENDMLPHLPNWTGFYTMLQQGQHCDINKSNIGYLPVISASPTQYSTVYTVLQRSIKIADKLGLENIVIVFDQAIYSKAQQIRWQNEALKERIVIRLGEFHTAMSFMAILGRIFGDAGLQDVLTETGIIAPGSVHSVLNGHQYNRSIRAHKIVSEALDRLRFKCFLEKCNPEDKKKHLDFLNEQNTTFLDSTSQWKEQMMSPQFNSLVEDYQNFVMSEVENKPTFALWSMYIDLVELLLTFVRATRESNWPLHLAVVRRMCPWYFAYDRVNYARYLPIYWSEMVMMKDTHPSAYHQITKLWTVQRQDKYPFSAVAADQAIEQSLNRDTKTKGGIKGFTLTQGAVDRWTLAQAERVAITRQCEIMAGKDTDKAMNRKDIGNSATKKCEKSIQSTISFLTSSINPFTTSSVQLVNITTGVEATKEIQTDFKNARKLGEQQFEEFVKTKIKHQEKSVFDTLPKNKLKTFANLRKPVKATNKKGETTIIQSDRELFARLLVIGSSRRIDIKQLLKYNLSAIPLSFGNPDGSLVKNTKSVLLHALESQCPDSPELDSLLSNNTNRTGALIIDGMAKLQSLKNLETTFLQLAVRILRDLEHYAESYHCSRIDFVTDRYFKHSIKHFERKKRSDTTPPLIYSIQNGTQNVPKSWAKFMTSPDNKRALVQYLINTWSTLPIKLGLKVFVTHESNCTKLCGTISGTTTESVSELECDHEEADTRMILHASHASKDHHIVFVDTPDTDVLAIMVSLNTPTNIYMITGKGDQKRIVDVPGIKTKLGVNCSSIIGLHVFTGSDSTSAFHGKGKKRPFEIMLGNKQFVQVFSKLGEEFTLNSSLIPILERFVCHMYNQPSAISIDECRYKVFCSNPHGQRQLPPNGDCLHLHIQRSNYQCAIHRGSLHQFVNAPSPVDHGWFVENDEISVKWMNKPHAPSEIISNVNCKCKTHCKSNRCSCKKNKVLCTDMCACNSCENHTENHTHNESDSSDEDE